MNEEDERSSCALLRSLARLSFQRHRIHVEHTVGAGLVAARPDSSAERLHDPLKYREIRGASFGQTIGVLLEPPHHRGSSDRDLWPGAEFLRMGWLERTRIRLKSGGYRSRFPQPENETHAAIKSARIEATKKAQEQKRRRRD